MAIVSALALAATLGCRGSTEGPEAGAILLRAHLAPGAPMPDELRLFVYDDTGILWQDARTPSEGPLVAESATLLGTILIKPGTTVGDLRIDVDACSLEACVIGFDVARREDDPGVDGRGAALHRRRERDRRRAAGRNDLDPPHLPVGERDVAPQLEPERADVELERAILIACRDGYATDLRDVQLAGHGRLLIVDRNVIAQTVGVGEIHRPCRV
jgi:hypothetical protein